MNNNDKPEQSQPTKKEREVEFKGGYIPPPPPPKPDKKPTPKVTPKPK